MPEYVARVDLKFGLETVVSGRLVSPNVSGFRAMFSCRHILPRDEFERRGGVVLDDLPMFEESALPSVPDTPPEEIRQDEKAVSPIQFPTDVPTFGLPPERPVEPTPKSDPKRKTRKPRYRRAIP